MILLGTIQKETETQIYSIRLKKERHEQKCVYNPVEHLRSSCFAKIANE